MVQLAIALVGLVVAGVLTVLLMVDDKKLIAAQGAISVDGPALFTWITLLALTVISVLLFAERSIDGGLSAFAGQAAAVPGSEAEREGTAAKVEHTEVFPLTLFAVGGMMLFASANDLLVLFVALEVFSLPLYLLCGLARRRRLISQEAAMKYFLLGAFASAFLLYGIALLYGYAGTMSLGGISDALATKTGGDAMLLAGTGLIAVGLLFKVGAVPFHSWTPDVYQGAPTPVTGFMAACTKIAAFIGLMRVFYVALGGTRWDWAPMMWIVAILTMVVGSIVALTQTDVKRMLAYSSIAHAGFLLTAFVGLCAGRQRSHRQHHLDAGGAVLPGLLRLPDHRRLRFGDAGPRRGRRGDAPVALGRTRQEVAAAGWHLRLLPARLRGYPADRRASPASGPCSPPPGPVARGRWSWSRCSAAWSPRSSTSA